MGFCHNCGFKVSAGSKFCGNCGCALKPEDISYEITVDNPIDIVIRRVALDDSYINKTEASYADSPPLSLKQAIDILHEVCLIVDEFCNADAANINYIILRDKLAAIYRRLVSGNICALSENEIKSIKTVITLLSQAVSILKNEANSSQYAEHIHKWERILMSLRRLISGGLAGVDGDNSASERHPSDTSTPNANTGKLPSTSDLYRWRKDIDQEIRSLESDLDRLIPNLKIHEYDSNRDYWAELDALTGLNGVKQQLKDYIDAFRVHKVRKDMHPNLRTEFSFNCIFKGRPGTGKTTVARILAGILKNEDIIKIGQCVETDASKLTSGWIGFTSKCTRYAALKSVGGVLFIDEAYSLMTGKGGNNRVGDEAIDTLTPIMTNYLGDLVVILAGYEEEMNRFMSEANTGLASRFQRTIDFEDYRADEMLDIFINIATENYYYVEERASQRLSKLLTAIAARKDKNPAFANARTVRSIFDLVRSRAAQRYIKDNSINPDVITIDDVTLSSRELKSVGAI